MIIGTVESRTADRPASFRWKAFAIHLSLSLAILGALLYVLFYYWFPGYLFDTDGGWQALRVIAGVDIILGPLLTLVAANPKKSTGELRKDFTVIGLIQVCALSVGTWLAWDNRPYAMLWYDGLVYSLPWSSLKNEPTALEALRRTDALHRPRRAVIDLPFDPAQRADILAAARINQELLLVDGRHYRAWPPAPRITEVFTQLSLEMARDDAGALRDALQAIRREDPEADLVPVHSRYASYFLVMNRQSGEITRALRIQPAQKMLVGLYPFMRMKELFGGNLPASMAR